MRSCLKMAEPPSVNFIVNHIITKGTAKQTNKINAKKKSPSRFTPRPTDDILSLIKTSSKIVSSPFNETTLDLYSPLCFLFNPSCDTIYYLAPLKPIYWCTLKPHIISFTAQNYTILHTLPNTTQILSQNPPLPHSAHAKKKGP